MKFTDETPIPFGKHCGTPLEDVPADYLIWCRDNIEPTTPAKRALLEYIAENDECLEKEVADDRYRPSR